MITAIIIEDEAKSRLSLRQKLLDYCKAITVVAEADSGQKGIELIEQYQPQVIFLDIEMPLMNGFDMLQQIPLKNFHIIFTTAYNQYAIKAIRYAAFDYLLKPVDIEELKMAVEKISQHISVTEQDKKVETLHQNLVISKGLNKIAIPTAEGLLFFDIKNMVHLEANSNYTTIFFSNRPKLISSKTLKEFEELLPKEMFFRCHHSHLINLGHIKKYIKGDGGQIELQDGTCVDLARRKKDEFLKLTG